MIPVEDRMDGELMKLKTTMLAAAAAISLAAGSLATAAQATIITATFTGKVYEGLDGANLFGGGDLAGLDFTSVFTFDTSIGLGDEFPAYSPGEGRVGGSGFITGESLTINHLTHSENFTFHNEVVYDPFGFADVLYGAYGPGYTTALQNQLNFGGFHSFTDTGYGTGTDQGSSFSFNVGGLNSGGRLNTQTISVQGPGGFPDPATWALMILGFGGVGASLRSRRKVALA